MNYFKSVWIVILVIVVLVSYQNCGPQNTENLNVTPAGSTSCEIKSYNSAGISKNSYYIGEIANFSLKSVVDGQTIQYSLQKNSVIIQNNNVASPYYFQLTNKDNNSLGDYVLTMNLLDNGKSVCTKSLSFTVQLEGTTSCQLSALSGTNFKTNEQIPLLITSNPTGKNAFLSSSGLWNRKVKGTTSANFVETIATPGTYTVYAEVSDSSGDYQRCAPDVVLTITAVTVSPTPVSPTPTIPVTPTPKSPTPTPPKPSPTPPCSGSPARWFCPGNTGGSYGSFDPNVCFGAYANAYPLPSGNCTNLGEASGGCNYYPYPDASWGVVACLCGCSSGIIEYP